MEEVRDQQVYKHVCKLCNKRYPSGKSLGGHMRSHVIANAQKNKPISKKAPTFPTLYDDDEVDDEDEDDDNHDDDDVDEINGGDLSEREIEIGNEGKNSGYGLRENPKKSWRLVNSKLTNKNISGKFLHPFHLQQQQQEEKERVCKQCGKGFHSLKALCGHMSSHSDHKERNFKEEEDDDNSWSSDSKEQLILAMETHSDNHHHRHHHHNIGKRRTRSSLLRYKSITAVDSLSPPPTGGAGSGGGGNGGGSSSNHSEIDQHEQEEVAMCLMMLSRDSSGFKTCFNFAAESSDNNSVILEGGSSSNYVGIGVRRKDISLIHDNNSKIKQVIVIAKEDANANVMNNASNHQEINNSDSGYFENGAKELESDDSVDGFVRNFGFKKPKIDFGSRVVEDSIHKDDDDSKKKRIRELGTNFNSDSPESDEKCSKKIMKQDYYSYTKNNNNNNLIKKGSKYECWICNRTFKTHQALGGHIISHRKTGENNIDSSNSAKKELKNGSNSKNLVAATTSTNTTTTKIMSSSKAKKVKGHKCPYCPRVFKSGQALGGHKRSHMLGGASAEVVNLHLDAEKSRIEREWAPPPPPPPPEPEHQHQLPPLIDLNFPPMEEEGCANSQFVWHGDG